MAKKEEIVAAADKIRIPREIGSVGNYKPKAMLYSDISRDLDFPKSIETFRDMTDDVTIASAIAAVQVVSSRIPIYVEAYDQSDEHKERKAFLESCLEDMEHSFQDAIKQMMTFRTYGFSIAEKVYRFRRRKKGSKHDDNKIGIKKLAFRPQHTITEFRMSDDNRDFLGVVQGEFSHGYGSRERRIPMNQNGDETFIPKSRMLLFVTDNTTGLPYGRSPLVGCYQTWRDLQKVQDLEYVAMSKNLNGLPLATLPARFLTADADEDEVDTRMSIIDGISKVGIGEQSSFVLPSDRDQDGNPLFDLKLLQASSSNVTSISAIVSRLKKDMKELFFNDLGDEGTGSLLNMLVESCIKEIFEVLNRDLIPELWELNGWDITKTPKLKYGSLKEVNMADFAKAIQQLSATKNIAKTPDNLNMIAEIMGLPYRFASDATEEEIDKILRVEEKDESRSGDGYEKGSGNGTSDKVSEKDNSANNLSNK